MVVFFFAEEEQYCHVANLFVEWIVDSAVSYDVTPKRKLFTSYKAGNFAKVKMGNDSHADIVGIC